MTQSVDVEAVAETLPEYAHPGDAGADLRSADAVTIAPGRRATVGTGVSVAIPDGFAGFVVPRSGLAAKHGITIVNAPGTIDAGYRGELRVTLLNTDLDQPYPVQVGDRIAQLILVPVAHATFVGVDELSDSARGTGGFGSTGYSDLTRGGAA
ncbi:dUTP diphosphatase [Gryllotalpicola sp.]|uniref:dUTP diphosphatase n=1 Tax=Gryllotalpicola sp. TaxID=1932787 RepID=UPI002616DA57|nr:dUTP diphosphatase [Gryllotalpicola sp.]